MNETGTCSNSKISLKEITEASELLKTAYQKIQSKKPKIIGVTVKPEVYHAIKSESEKIMTDFLKELPDHYHMAGLHVYVDNDADYPFTPIYEDTK